MSNSPQSYNTIDLYMLRLYLYHQVLWTVTMSNHKTQSQVTTKDCDWMSAATGSDNVMESKWWWWCRSISMTFNVYFLSQFLLWFHIDAQWTWQNVRFTLVTFQLLIEWQFDYMYETPSRFCVILLATHFDLTCGHWSVMKHVRLQHESRI